MSLSELHRVLQTAMGWRDAHLHLFDVDGARACPPQDCGGPPGHAHLTEVLADPAPPERAELLEWRGGGFDPEAFDRAAVERALQA